jgi:hypothetical protein
MTGSCCAKPIATIIKVGASEAGISGLEAALRNVYVSGITDEEQIKSDLLQWVRQFGNYVATTSENDYKKALLREYQQYAERVKNESNDPQSAVSAQSAASHEQTKRKWFHRRKGSPQ